MRKYFPVTSLVVLMILARTSARAADVDVANVGAVGDGQTLNTEAIQKAIDDCAATGGGQVTFPAGRYVSGTLQLKSGVTLHLNADATLLGSTNAEDYRNLDPFTDGSGQKLGHALVVAIDADHVGITGPGTIDGQNAKLAARQKPYRIRPFLVRWVRCANVSVREVHLMNPGSWTLNFFQSKNITIDGITIRSREPVLRNTDGIDLDSSQAVHIQHCDVVSGDDALVIKSTLAAQPSRDIVATDCKLSTRTNAIKLGTESIGGFENIQISHCQITNTKMAGIALYEVDGGTLNNVSISDIDMSGVTLPICIRLGQRYKTFRDGDQPKTGGELRDVTIQNVTAKQVGTIGMLINGVPGQRIDSLTFSNIHLTVPGGGTEQAAQTRLAEHETAYPEWNMFGAVFPAYGIYARHVQGMHLQDVTLTPAKPDARPAVVLIDVQDLTPADFGQSPK